MSESITASHGWIGTINIYAVREACIAACLEAMLDERRFTYTDLYVKPRNYVYLNPR